MLDILDPVHFLHLRVLEEDPRHESLMHHDINILIDRRGDEEAAVLLVVRRQVGPPAAEGDAERAAGHDHDNDLPLVWWDRCTKNALFPGQVDKLLFRPGYPWHEDR